MPSKLQTFVQAAFVGMRDTLEPESGTARYAQLLQNVYPINPDKGGGCDGRPGLIPFGVAAVAAGYPIQAIQSLTKTDATNLSFAIAKGGLYAYVTASGVWQAVTLASGCTLPGTGGAVYCTTFNGALVVNPSDGTNKPWTYDGTTMTPLTNAPVAYGRPTVYYAKLFFIVYGTRNQIQWSEENAANTGYNAGAYVNYWNLTQTNDEPLYALQGTNEALYYWRESSIGAIIGAVTPTFQTSGTHDLISGTVGTTHPNCVTPVDADLYFVTRDDQPYVLRQGGALQPLWSDVRQSLPKAQADPTPIGGAYFSFLPLVLFNIARASASFTDTLLAVKPGSPAAPIAGLWTGFGSDQITALGVLKEYGTNHWTVALGRADGWVYYFALPDLSNAWMDQFASGNAAITHVVTTGYLGYDPRMSRQFDLARIAFKSYAPLTSVSVTGKSPAFSETIASSATVGPTGGPEMVLELGTGGYGRYAQFTITHSGFNERFGVNTVAVNAFDSGVDVVPLAPIGMGAAVTGLAGVTTAGGKV